MNQVLHLFQLQKIDTQLDQIAHRLAEISAILLADRTVQLADQNLDQVKANHLKAHHAVNSAEENVKAQRIKIETSESALYGGKIKNPKELQDLQSEIVSLKKFLTALEDQQLESMFAFERAEAELQTAQKELSQAQAHQAVHHADLLGEQDKLSRAQSRLNTERPACLSQISEENLLIYKRLREQKRGLAVSVIEDGSCKACGASLRPAELQSARSPNNLVYCSTCSRIVYGG